MIHGYIFTAMKRSWTDSETWKFQDWTIRRRRRTYWKKTSWKDGLENGKLEVDSKARDGHCRTRQWWNGIGWTGKQRTGKDELENDGEDVVTATETIQSDGLEKDGVEKGGIENDGENVVTAWKQRPSHGWTAYRNSQD